MKAKQMTEKHAVVKEGPAEESTPNETACNTAAPPLEPASANPGPSDQQVSLVGLLYATWPAIL